MVFISTDTARSAKVNPKVIPHLSSRGRAIHKRGAQRLQSDQMIAVHMAQKASQRRPVCWMGSEIVDPNLRELGDDAFEG